MQESSPERRARPAEAGTSAETPPTVEAEVRAKLAEALGGLRGSLETALPLLAFTLAYLLTEELPPAIVVGLATAALAFAVRLAQRSCTRFVRNGLLGIALGAVLASVAGRAEAAFLPGIIQSAAWAVVLGGSVLLRWPAAGFLIGAVLGESTGWRNHPAILRLANRLTLVLLLPMLVRVGVQYPLYLAGEVGWLAVSRIVLGWPLAIAALAVAGAILMRGATPLHRASPSE